MPALKLPHFVLLGLSGCAAASGNPESPRASGGAGTGGAASAAATTSGSGSGQQGGGAGAAVAADQDRDGIPDTEDSCPNEPGTASAARHEHGCPKQPLADIPLNALLISPLIFQPGSRGLEPAQDYAELDRLALRMKEHPDHCLFIVGHADSRKDPGGAASLSVARARSVEKYLAAHAVPAARMATQGAGSDCAIEPGVSDNRRVSIRVLACPIPATPPVLDCRQSKIGIFPFGPAPIAGAAPIDAAH
ncbi:MAG TPA: OmpA family protein [Polyangiaceae bacterium]|nr:OmpA family protein [Polyangiaceae bacterium]